MSEHTDPLARAIELSLEFKSLEGDQDVESFLRQHESLRDVLEPMLLPDLDDELDEPEVIGEYELVRELGQGGMGVVYEAVQPLIGRTVALKLLPPHRAMSPRSLAMFRREATLAASLDHPGIARVFSLQEVDGQLALAMELIDGLSIDRVIDVLRGDRLDSYVGKDVERALRQARHDPYGFAPELLTETKTPGPGSDPDPRSSDQDAVTDSHLTATQTTPLANDLYDPARNHRAFGGHLAQRRPKSTTPPTHRSREKGSSTGSSEKRDIWSLTYVDVAVDLMRQVANALSHAHARGVVHRDVKPANIMLTEVGDAILTDFGLAREAGFGGGVTRTGEFAGTYQYAAPEQLAGRLDEIDGRTDVYALGVTLYELLTLRRPFEADSLIEFCAKIEVEEPEPPSRRNPRVGRDLDAVVLCALEKRREQRYASANEMAIDLAHVLAGEPVKARRISVAGRSVRWVQRNRLASTVVIVLMISSVLISIFAANAAASAADASASNRRYESLWTGAAVAAIEQRAARAIPSWPEQSDELARLVEMAEKEILPMRTKQEEALTEVRTGYMLDATMPRSPDRMPHPAVARIDQLRGQRNKLEVDSGVKLDPKVSGVKAIAAARQEADDLKREIDQEIAALEAMVETSNRVQIPDRRESILHDRLETQLFNLRQFERYLLSDLRARLEWSEQIFRASIGDHTDAWREAKARLATDKRFANIEVRPQTGLVPLGPDPKSGFEEFAHLGSGDMPKRAADGRLDFGEAEVTDGDLRHGIVFVLLPGSAHTGKGFEAVVGVKDGLLIAKRVALDPFFVSKYEINRAQWRRLAKGIEGLRLRDFGFLDVRNSAELFKPANAVPWDACQRLLARWGLDLPTVAQWEYAARQGGGPPEDVAELVKAANLRNLKDGYGGLAPITTMQPSPAGIHHLFGNVKEWCRDVFLAGDADLRPGDGLRISPAWRDANRMISGPGFLSIYRNNPAYNLLDRAAPFDRSRDTGVRPVRKLH